jgi:hypothetical protein
MIKKCLASFFFLLSLNTIAQGTFTVTFFDIETKVPIEDARVYVNRSKENHLTNKEGAVTFTVNGPSTIEVTHISYKKLTFNTKIIDKKSIEFYLEPNVKNIQEIIITQRHPQLILKDIVENSRKQISLPANLKVYTREFYNINDQFVYFNDGLLNFQLFKEKNKSLKTDILIEQTRSLGLIDPLDKEVLGYDLEHLMTSYQHFNYLDFITSRVAIGFFDYTLKSHPTNPSLLIMMIEPKKEKGGLLHQYAITYDEKRKLILELEIEHPSERLEIFKVIKDHRGRNLISNKIKNLYYLSKENHYYLLQSVEEIKFKHIKQKKEQVMQVKNMMHVLNYSTKLFAIDEKYILKQKSLINKKSMVHTPFWIDQSGSLLTVSENQLLEKLNDAPELYYNIYKE